MRPLVCLIDVKVYRWTKGPLLSVEAWSHRQGTVLDVHVAGKRSVTITVPLGAVPIPVTRIRARRLYRMPWS